MTHPDARPRSFLFLQGLASGFFDRLGKALAHRGHTVLRVNLNGGDWLFWRGQPAVNYRGRAQDWPNHVAALMAERRITDLVLFGDCRPMHRAAIEAANGLNIAVHVCEEGYLRPDWVTVERGGVNGHSTLPRDPDWYREQAARLPAADPIPTIPSSFRRRATEDVAYNFGTSLLRPFYPFYETHRPWHPAVEYAGWVRRLLRRGRARRRSEAAIQRLQAGQRFMLFPLQLDCDSQIRLHSSFTGIAAAIDKVLRSFARYAPVDLTLLVKEHPLDNGLKDWRAYTLGKARELGIADRLVYIEQGDIALLVRAAAGLVTVNSTTGTLSLASGVPTICLGNAIYDLRGLTFQDELDRFWTEATPPDADLFDAFRRVLVNRCLVRGGFFSERGLDLLVQGAVARLEAAEPSPALRGVLAERPARSRFALPQAAALRR